MTPQEIADALEAAVRRGIESAQPLPPKLMFTAAEAAELLSLPENWLKTEAREGRIPSCKPGGEDGKYRRFSLADLEAIVAAYELKPTSGLMARLERARAGARRAA